MKVATDRALAPGNFYIGKWASRARPIYFDTLVVLILASSVAAFLRDQDPLLRNISFWLGAVAFVVSLVSTSGGLLAAALLLTVSPSLHLQLNALSGTELVAWTYPGVDAGIGFIAGWLLKGGLKQATPRLQRFPGGLLLILHLWIAFSAAVTVGRNLWQSASEFSWRGFASHGWLVRRIGLLDDYLPLQDLFYFTVALALVFSAHSVVARDGHRLISRLAVAILVGAAANAVFAAWQTATGAGWFLMPSRGEVNAFWPDLHSFAALMAMVITIGCGLLATAQLSFSTKFVVASLLALVTVGLFLSGSRSTLLIVVGVFAVAAVAGAAILQGKRRAWLLGSLLAILGGVYWAFTRGYRNVSFATLRADLGPVDFNSVSTVLSHRPEIWESALKMYSSFPFFGLGQGAFFRASAIASFSGSEVLVGAGGGGAHNFFLQAFVELGPVGLCLALLIAIPFARAGRYNLKAVSFFALAGVAMGNVYAHSLLVRETLMLAAIFAGAYLWESEKIASELGLKLEAPDVRRSSWTIVALMLLATLEIALSFGKFPFTYGLKCDQERPLTWDGWTNGSLRVEVPSAAAGVRLTLLADRRDLSKNPLDVAVTVNDQKGGLLLQRVERFVRPDEGPHHLTLPFEESLGNRLSLGIRPSRCYVPLNLGRGHDGRHLGVRVQTLEFLPAEP